MNPADVTLTKLAVGSASRTVHERIDIVQQIGDKKTAATLRSVVRPRSMYGTLRSGGIALLLAPDPVTSVAGVAMLGASVYAKKREPLNASSVIQEARKILEDLRL